MEELFLEACEENSISFCSKYIRKYLNVNYSDSNGCTGLMKACLNGHYNLVKLLIENNANVNLTDKNGQNALHYAVMGKHEKLCKLLCCNKIESNQKCLQNGLDARDISLVTVPDLDFDKLKMNVKNPLQHKYMLEVKNIIEAEDSILKRDEPKYVEEKIFDLITRYKDLNLSEIESEDDDLQKGNGVKKERKKKKGTKKKGKASGKKKKKGKSGKKK